MKRQLVGSLLVVLVIAGLARGQAKPKPPGGGQGVASREIVVEGSGGGYEITVSGTYVTVLYLPEKVTGALMSDQKTFTVSVVDDTTLAVRPVKGAHEGAKANLAIDAGKLKINVLLIVGDDADAVSQVIFTRAADKEAFEKRVNEEVEKRVAPIREEYERKTKELESLVNAKAEREIAERMMRRFETRGVSAVARTDDNQVLRVTRAASIGDDAYVFFTVQNRDSAAYPLKQVAVRQEKRDVPARAFLEGVKDDAEMVGIVPPGRTLAGVAVVSLAKIAPGRALAIVWVAGGKAESVTLDGIRVD
jgi:hypothetical protein